MCMDSYCGLCNGSADVRSLLRTYYHYTIMPFSTALSSVKIQPSLFCNYFWKGFNQINQLWRINLFILLEQFAWGCALLFQIQKITVIGCPALIKIWPWGRQLKRELHYPFVVCGLGFLFFTKYGLLCLALSPQKFAHSGEMTFCRRLKSFGGM